MAMQADKRSNLERQDWINAAYQVLIEEGVHQVRILNLADRLGISRGSFYWHFKNRADLLDALISTWQQKNTGALVAACRRDTDFTGRMLAIADCWVYETHYDPALDAAMRSWAQYDAAVYQVVQAEDRKRLAAFQRLFREHGFTSQQAMIRARVFYFTQVGYFALGVKETESVEQRLALYRDYFLVFTGDPLDEARLQQHLNTPPSA